MLWITVPGLYLSEIDWVLTPTQICFALFLLWIECRSKDPILRVAYRMEPPEAATSFLGRVFFSWINPVLVEGYNKVLVEDDLPALDRELSSKSLRQGVLRAWDQRGVWQFSETRECFLFSKASLQQNPRPVSLCPRSCYDASSDRFCPWSSRVFASLLFDLRNQFSSVVPFGSSCKRLSKKMMKRLGTGLSWRLRPYILGWP